MSSLHLCSERSSTKATEYLFWDIRVPIEIKTVQKSFKDKGILFLSRSFRGNVRQRLRGSLRESLKESLRGNLRGCLFQSEKVDYQCVVEGFKYIKICK